MHIFEPFATQAITPTPLAKDPNHNGQTQALYLSKYSTQNFWPPLPTKKKKKERKEKP
jgi:hypothetical protein